MKAAIQRVNASSKTNSGKVQQLQTVRFQPIRAQGRKLALAYLGLWGIVCDQVGGLYQSSEKLLNDAVERGERMEEALYATLAEWSRCITKQQAPFHEQVEADFRRSARLANEAGQDFEAQLERQVERADPAGNSDARTIGETEPGDRKAERHSRRKIGPKRGRSRLIELVQAAAVCSATTLDQSKQSSFRGRRGDAHLPSAFVHARR